MIPADLLRRIARLEHASERARKTPIPGAILCYAPRVLNPFPLASSGNASGDFAQSDSISILAFNVSVYVATTNNGSNYWTLVVAENPGGTTVASVSTIAISANTQTRLAAVTITQPSSSNTFLTLTPTATGSPGAIYIVPELIGAY